LEATRLAPLTILRYTSAVTLALDAIAPGFLIAAPLLRDPSFERTVVLMCLHNDEGAMGLVVNRPAPLSFGELLAQLDLDAGDQESAAVFYGGPVAQESGLLLYQPEVGAATRDDELLVGDELHLCPNRELLQAIGEGQGPSTFRLFLGHSGWGPGQLETELAQGAWIPAPLQLDLIFSVPIEKRWDAALARVGGSALQFGGSRPKA
jgi:putative transcriptional regulator